MDSSGNRDESDAVAGAPGADGLGEVLASGPVRERVLEFLGGRDLASATCSYLALADSANPSSIEQRPVADLDSLLEADGGLARSLYDTRSVLVHLDIEYVNHDEPAAAFIDPWRAFRLQEPVVCVIEELLAEWGIRPLHILTGQGHHFVWSFPRGSELERRLTHMVPNADPDGGEQVFANLALLMEYFAQRIKARSAGLSGLPVEITALNVPPGPPRSQREMVSVDISEYGDPLESRSIRVPFTRYVKPWRSGMAQRLGVEDEIGPCIALPLYEMDAMQALKCRQDPADVAALSRRCSVAIPEQTEGAARMLDDYLASELRAFHRRYYEASHDPPEIWPDTYARTPLDDLPGCIRHVLLHPNDLLLKPSGLRLVTRGLLARGWHPRHVAGLVRSKFEDPSHDWGAVWEGYSPKFRADFYVRLFAGQLATGLDRMAEFSCQGEKARGFCWPGDPPCDLRPLREALERSARDGSRD